MGDADHGTPRPLATARRGSISRPSRRAIAIGSSPSTATWRTLVMDVDEKAALFEGYDLKLNSYDLGVDIELADAIERLRFEHPQARVVVLRSAKPRVFSRRRQYPHAGRREPRA